jgi:uncharacterized membrane protein
VPEDGVNRNPSTFESMIGARVLLGAGLISLLAGAVFFVKISNDHHWIPPEIRILCGVLAGLALMLGGAWRMQTRRTLVAEGITGLGASVLYLSLWGAFGPFHLIDYRIAFAAMIAVSAALALVAWVRKSENVALAGLIGGYLTPALLIAGPFDRVVLAVYLAVLSAAMLTLAVGCRYRRVEAASFVAALCYAPAFVPVAGVWDSTHSLAVASALFAEFAVALFAAARLEGAADARRLVLLGGEVLAYAGVLELELGWNPSSLALADTALATVLLGAVAGRVPPAMRSAYAWCGLAILTRAIEAWGGSHALTASVAIEGAALFYLGVRGAREWMRTAGLLLLMLATAGAFMHLVYDAPQIAIFNLRTFAVAAVVLSLAATLRELRTFGASLEAAERHIEPILTVAIAAFAVAAGTLDAITATSASGAWTGTTQTAISVLWSVAATALIALGFKSRDAVARWLGIALFAVTIGKVFLFDLTGLDVMERVVSALVLGAVLVIVAGFYQLVMLRERRAS